MQFSLRKKYYQGCSECGTACSSDCCSGADVKLHIQLSMTELFSKALDGWNGEGVKCKCRALLPLHLSI